ncbi:hypothetical protein TNCV_4463661 [Trichonephila clavipes]|nr:hypothetical protein TNCV_4463661 [Trichonephila clavipes]
MDSKNSCIDYRKLNQLGWKDKFLRTIIEDVYHFRGQRAVYSAIPDFTQRFLPSNVDADEDCSSIHLFVVPDGQLEFNKVPFD